MGQRYLIDSNILIEFIGGLLPSNAYLDISVIIKNDFNISFINKIEVLGHYTVDQEWNDFINQANIIKADEKIITITINIRKNHKIKVPDAIVAATALANNLVLMTRNTKDFKNIEGLRIENPWLDA